MASLQTFHKIKDLRDREKKDEQKRYQRAVETFEEVATKLYQLLREKEQAEDNFERALHESHVQAMSFIQHQQYIERLEQQITLLQPDVQQARQAMEKKQENLTNAYVEVKKFEKLIEKKVKKNKQWVKEEDSKQMDELSMRQFLNYKNG